jgi:16S rRNA (guanine527-N7)-methyltransferase
MLDDLLKSGAEEIGVKLTPDQVADFTVYLHELLAWNKKVNLTAITKEEDVIVKHFLDSLILLKAFQVTNQSFVDIGAGGGFPGIPIKIVKPEISLVLVDSVKKKVDFLDHMINKLHLRGAGALWGRVEDAARNRRERFDVSVSRALAPLNVLIEYSLPFVKVGGLAVALKGEDVSEELADCQNALKEMGGRLKEVIKVKLPTTDIIRSIVVIEKISQTPDKFPRRAGIPKKRPL